MALVVGTNSYVTVAEADLYFTDRLYSDDWLDLNPDPDGVKDKSLISACLQVLETLCAWDYSKTDSDQDLAFPRNGDTEVPEDIKIAQMEIALEIISQGVVSFTEESDELKSLKAGSASLSFYEKLSNPMTIINNVTKSRVSPYGYCNFGSGTVTAVPLVR